MFGVNKETREMLERIRHQQEGIINSQRLLTERLEAIENKLGTEPTVSPLKPFVMDLSHANFIK